MTTKTLVASLAAVAASSVLVAQGATEPAWNSSLKGSTINAVGFENFDVGDTPSQSFDDNGDGVSESIKSYFLYSGTNGDDQSAVKSHESGVEFPSSVPGYFSTFDTNSKYLSLSTEGGTLFRSLNTLNTTGEAVALGDAEPITDAGLYVDTLVQFTPCEEAPTFNDGANKLAVWLNVSETETEGVFETNLCVRAGSWQYVDEVLSRVEGGATYTLANTDEIQIEAGEWVRLTVKAIKDVYTTTQSDPMPAFQVYINDTLAEFNEAVGTDDALAEITALDNAAGTTLATKTVLPSMSNVAELQAVGFQGTGAIDDFVVTTDKPNFLAVDFTLYWDANVAQLEAYLNYENIYTPEIEYTLGDLKVALGAAAAVAGNTVSFFLQEGTYGTYAKDGYEIDWANTVLTNVTMEALYDYGYKFTAVGEGPYSITLVTKEAATPEPETPTVTPDSAVVEVVAEDADAAIAKVQISITDSAAKAAGQEAVVKLVATETSPGSGKWNVTVAINEQADAFVDPDEAVAEVAGALSGAGTSVSIAAENLTPGLYYSLGKAAAVDGTYEEGTRVLATGSNDIDFTLDKSGTAGFFKVFVNMTGNASAE